MTKPDEQEAMSRLAQAAQSVPPPHTAEFHGIGPPPLAALHARSVALKLPVIDGERILVGVAEYVNDPDLGPALRVFVEDVAELEILLTESTFKGQITSGAIHGGEFLIDLGATSRSAEARPTKPMRNQPS